MAKDKDKASVDPHEEELIKHVDAMMDISKPDPVVATPTPKSDDSPIDIFKDAATAGTAPKLPSTLLKEIETTPAKTSAKPTKIATAEAEPDESTEAPAKTGDDEPSPNDPETEQATNDKGEATVKLDDPDTDKAVDSIVAKEGDEVLAVEDAKTKRGSVVPKKPSKLAALFKKKWTWVGIVVVVLAIIFGLPQTRYTVLGLVLKGNVDVTVVDSTTNTPVSSAEVTLDGVTAKTNGHGQAKLHVPMGKHTLKVSKQYYRTFSQSYTVGFKTGKFQPGLMATGRQVPLTVLNTITGKPIANADIQVLDTAAKTDSKGKAIIVVPTKNTSDSAKVSASGYNSAQVTIKVTDKVVASNTIHLAPSGRIYFLSNQSGNIDVVSTNLDGSGRKVVFAGTGNEDPNSTSLLASRDWKYLVLESARDSSSQAALYLINTSDDSTTKFESSSSNLSLIGWHGHDFLYALVNNSKSYDQAGRQSIKTYNADNQQTNLLDQNQVAGVPVNYAYQSFSQYYVLGDELVYATQWYSDEGNSDYYMAGKSDTVRGVDLTSHTKKDFNSFKASENYLQLVPDEPDSIYYSIYNTVNGNTTYRELEDGKVSAANLTSTEFNKAYPTYLLSPSGNQNFWTEYRDGKNTLFLGDEDAEDAKQIATLSDYSPYGWYTDDYLLVTKNNSELYILPTGPLSQNQKPFKISDYYKAQSYPGYGGGYGG
ncbi:MAG TPA: hypothetical protein VG604_00245 [Candidatus Saccharimonadales bacterium]|nr:hypothetical protein [Candidatus Saccharimonadales bacterium]